ncbi:glycosyltransferase [Shinella sp. G-2]|uniref:glycosyltransferase n=1 Tax=Shinella sp. G-2 TaxID=3133141 RepID=UPI003CFF6105
MKVCLVTNELPGLGPSGGIGTAFQELSYTLSRNGFSVDILYAAARPMHADKIVSQYREKGIKVQFVDSSEFVWDFGSPLGRSYAIYKTLLNCTIVYDFIHFAEYGGIGFYAIQAKRLLNYFNETSIVVQTHGSTRWALTSNSSPLAHQNHLLVDFMECRCIEGADHVVSPSQYLLDWFVEHGLAAARKGKVIPNLASTLKRREDADRGEQISEIIMFGRHEFRKGLTTFCDALDILRDNLAARNIRVTFLGQPSTLNEVPSEIYLTDRAKKWDFEIRILSNFSRDRATDYMSEADAPLVVIPSSQENSPYTVLESLALGVPLITSRHGGAKELVPCDRHDQMLFDGSAVDLATKISAAIENRLHPTYPATNNLEVERKWLNLHRQSNVAPAISPPLKAEPPRVVLGITHFERPEKLVQAVFSALDQTYPYTQVVVLDDGSKSPEAIAALKRVERLIAPSGGKVIIQQNGYLGAARNTIARETKSEYLVFLDDDDLALPHMIETLVVAAGNKPEAIIAPLNLAMEERRRGEALICLEKFQQRVSYFVSGGPISLMPFGNYLSTATALIPRSVFDSLKGYSELKGVGFEDFELYTRAVQEGYRVEALPEPLYLYEVDRPSMVSSTPAMANLTRVLSVVDITKDPQAWHDMISCVAAQETNSGVQGRTEWLEKQSPLSDHFEAIRAHRSNSLGRFQALENYAKAVKAPRAAAAWHCANLPIARPRKIDLDAVFDLSTALGRIPSLSADSKGFPAGKYQATPYTTNFFSLSLGFEELEETAIEWEVMEDSTATLDIKNTGGSRWISLEIGLNRFDLERQGGVQVELDLSSREPLSGSAIIRKQDDISMRDSDEQPYESIGSQTLKFEFRVPENWEEIPQAEPRFIMHLPLIEAKIHILGVRCSARPRDFSIQSQR